VTGAGRRHPGGRRARCWAVALTALGVASCAGIGGPAPAPLIAPDVALQTLSIEAPGPVENGVLIVMRLKNHDQRTLVIHAIDYRLSMDGRTLAAGRVIDPFDIPRATTALVGLPAVIRNADVIERISVAAGRRGIAYALTGTLEVGDEGLVLIPFRSEGTLFVPGLPPDVYQITAHRCGSDAGVALPSGRRDRAAPFGCRRSA
jgi:LEA14-like dessication related protein